MKYEEKIFEYIESHDMIKQGDAVILGLSGGADSVALFFVLKKYLKESGIDFSLLAFHLNHMIRGEEAMRDEMFCERLCEREGVPFESRSIDVRSIASKSGESVEEAARRIRYEALRNAFSDMPCKRRMICVAHHMSDQAETVLFNIARGSGISGVRGMTAVSGDVIRPLLAVDRIENERYLSDIGEDYVTDETNTDVSYKRNLIRKDVIPRLSEVNAALTRHISDLSGDVDEICAFLDDEVTRIFDEAVSYDRKGHILIKEKSLDKYARVMQTMLIRRALQKTSGHEKDIGRVHILSVCELFSSQTGRHIDLPYGMTALRTSDGIKLYVKEETSSDEDDDIRRDFTCRIMRREELSDNIPKKDYTKYFDYDRIVGELSFRHMRDHDFIVIDRAGSTKKLNRYMTDEKIDRTLRAKVPLVCDESHVLWVVGHRISEDVKVNDDTVSVIEINYTGGTKNG